MYDSVTHGLEPVRLLCPWGFSRQEQWSGLPCSFREPRSPTLQADSLLSEPSEKSKNTGVGRLSLLQGIFPTQELNQGLLPYSRILYQLSYQESPYTYIHMYILLVDTLCIKIRVYYLAPGITKTS